MMDHVEWMARHPGDLTQNLPKMATLSKGHFIFRPSIFNNASFREGQGGYYSPKKNWQTTFNSLIARLRMYIFQNHQDLENDLPARVMIRWTTGFSKTIFLFAIMSFSTSMISGGRVESNHRFGTYIHEEHLGTLIPYNLVGVPCILTFTALHG